MQSFIPFTSCVMPLDRPDVDTDAIIPKQFMKSIARSGFGANLFDEWRYLDPGYPGKQDRAPDPAFVLNQSRYRDAQILLARENFGCGSSREHALWALSDYGIRAVIAPSFASIFYANCFKNGLLPIPLDEQVVDRLFRDVEAAPGYTLAVDLVSQMVFTPGGEIIRFQIDGFNKRRLLDALDDISLTLQQDEAIRYYEQRRRTLEPWLFQ